MSGARRGRPHRLTVETDQEVIAELLLLIADGASVRAAAAELGMSVSPVYRLRRVEPRFRQALAEAQKAGRGARRPPPPSGSESRYVNQRCRCDRCVPAASAARAGRRRAARERRNSST